MDFQKMLRPAFALSALLLLAGCSDASVNLISADKIAMFKPGASTQAEVNANLGKPLHSIQKADGTKIDQYPAEAGAAGGSGLFPSWMGGSDTPESYTMVSFIYSPGGNLKDVQVGK
ncbi:MAG TPA: hypothetical protein VL899_07345 [Alphaproteobacteria bacterium]|jgi:hypothetical protein|nr:hypothetical protein [Alphaproteobacteria bacterium]